MIIFVFIFWFTMLAAWVTNAIAAILDVIHLDALANITGLIVAELVGIFIAPVGIIMGFWQWFN